VEEWSLGHFLLAESPKSADEDFSSDRAIKEVAS
jgi:hypothetical protein